jgi:cell division protein FtsL
MHAVEVLKHTVRQEDDSSPGIGYSTWVFIVSLFLAVALLYVWSHIHMTELEYQLARELTTYEQLFEEQKRLKVELATLKSPQRIESVALNKLQMIYPERKQVILLK